MTSFLLPLIAVAALGAPNVDVRLLDGGNASGGLVRWDAEGVVIDAADGEQSIAADRLLHIRWPEAAEATPADGQRFVELVDGTRLNIADFRVRRGEAEISLARGEQSLRVRTDLILRAELRPATDASRAVWQELESKQPAGDVLLISKGDGQAIDYLAGILGDVTDDHAQFQWEGDRLQVKRSKIAAIAYHRKNPPALPDPLCRLDAVDGSQIQVRQLSLDGEELQLVTPAGVELSIPLADVRLVDYAAGKIVYLSDLTPVVARWTPRIATPLRDDLAAAHGKPRNDQSFSGSAITLSYGAPSHASQHDVRVYSKGLAVRSRTELEYRLPADMQRFLATAGIDPLTAAQGRVALEIRGDGRLLWQGVVDGRQDPVELDLELNGARRLQILVDYGENLDYGDRLHLAEARVTK